MESAARCVELLKNALGIIEEEVKEYPVQKVRPCNLSIKYAPAAEPKVITTEKANTKETNTDVGKAVQTDRKQVTKSKEKKSRDDSKKRKEDKNKENGSEKISKNSETELKKKTSIGKLHLTDTPVISSPQFSPVVPMEKPQGRKSCFKNSSRKRKLVLEGGSIVPKVATPINMKKSPKISSVLSNAVKADVIKDVASSDIVTEVEAKDIKPKGDVKTKVVSKAPVKSNASLKRRKVAQHKKNMRHGTVKRMILDVGIEVPVDTVISDPDHKVLREVSPVKTKNTIHILDKISVENSMLTKTPSAAKRRSKSAGRKKGEEKTNESVVFNQSGDVVGDVIIEPQGPITGDLENTNPLIVGEVLPLTDKSNVDNIDAVFSNENAMKPKKGRRKQLKDTIKKVIQKKTPAKTIGVAKVTGNKVSRKKIASSVVSAIEKVSLKEKVIPSQESEIVAIPEAKCPVKNIIDIPSLKPLCNKDIIHVNLDNIKFSSTYAEIMNDKYIQPKVTISKIFNRSVSGIFANTPVAVDEDSVESPVWIENDFSTEEDVNLFVDLTDDNSITEFTKDTSVEFSQDSVLVDDDASNLPSSGELPGETDEAVTSGDVDCSRIPKTSSRRKRKFSMVSPPNNKSFKMKFKLNLTKNELKKIHTKNSRQSKKSTDSEKPAKKIGKTAPVKRVSTTGTNSTTESKSDLNVSKDGKLEALDTSESKPAKKKFKSPTVVASAKKLKVKRKATSSPCPSTPKNTQLFAGNRLVSPLRKSATSKVRKSSLGTIDQDLEMIEKAVKDQMQPDRPPPVLSYLSLYHN